MIELERTAAARAEWVGALTEHLGAALGADPKNVERLAEYSAWMFAEGAYYGIRVAKGKSKTPTDAVWETERFAEWDEW